MNTENTDEVVYLHLDDIIPNRFQPREIFDERALKELAVSIKEHGVIQPIIVRSVKGKYEIIAGERRYKASALAGLTKIPAIIRDLDDKESSKVALLENLQRKNLTPIEEARTYQKILEIDEMTQEELAKTMGRSQSSVANKLRLLSLPDEIQDALLKENISERHARALLNIPEPKKQKEMLKKIINNKMSVRSVEEEIKKLYPKEDSKDEVNANMDSEIIGVPSSAVIASTSDFVNTNPLLPTTDIPEEDEDNYGKVRIVPPKEEQSEENTKFINYGEINDEEEEEEEDSDMSLDFTGVPNQIDVNKIKENAVDISSQKISSNAPTADLDSLLNLKAPTNQSSSNDSGYKFITPAEEIVKTDANKAKNEKIGDYFKTPDLVSVELPSEVQTSSTANVSLDSILNQAEAKKKEQNKYTVEQAIEKINQLVEDLKEHDIKAEVDEMDFDKSYQIIIKFNKNQEEKK